jgi:hypothetical protein
MIGRTQIQNLILRSCESENNGKNLLCLCPSW